MSIGPINGSSGADPVQAASRLSDIFRQAGSFAGSGSPAGGAFDKISQGFSMFSGLLSLIPGVGPIASLATGFLGGIGKLFGGGRA